MAESKPAQPDEYKFRDESVKVDTFSKQADSSEAEKKVCCNNSCLTHTFSAQFLAKTETIQNMSKAVKKQFLLDHLGKQEELGIATCAFQFFGIFVCKKALASLSGVSNYIVGESCKAFENGQTNFNHNSELGMRETEATIGFLIWMKNHALNYGNQAPDEETLIIPACYMKKDLLEQYQEEAPAPHVSRATFYRLFESRFGAYRSDKTMPHIRISTYSSHSKCDECIALEKFQKRCKMKEDLELVKSLKQRHKHTHQQSYLSIQEKRFQAISDHDNYIHIQGMESYLIAVLNFFSSWRILKI